VKVLAITDKDSGCGYHRCTLPLAYLPIPKEDKLITNVYEEEMIGRGWDIILYNRFIPELPIEKLLEYKKKYGFKIVVDIDDYWKIDPHHIMHDDYKNGLGAVTVNNIVEADLVTCTHERLYDVIKVLNKNVEILPNALPYGDGFFNDEKVEDDRLRLIYAASIFHEQDVAILRNPIKKIYGDKHLRDKIKMVICGLHDKGNYSPEAWNEMNVWSRDNIEASAQIWHRMINDYTHALQLDGTVERSLPVYDYMQFYKHGDVGLIPLRDSGFNAMKSNLKILECAAKKIPVIVSNVQPYKDFPFVTKINSQPEWYKSVKFFAGNPTAVKEHGQLLHDYCADNYNLKKVSELRKQIFENLCR
jgi:glycosyltransferase involved in cell wall biosynthesis